MTTGEMTTTFGERVYAWVDSEGHLFMQVDAHAAVDVLSLGQQGNVTLAENPDGGWEVTYPTSDTTLARQVTYDRGAHWEVVA